MLAWLPAGAVAWPDGSATVTTWMLAEPTVPGSTLLLKAMVTGRLRPAILPPLGPELTWNTPGVLAPPPPFPQPPSAAASTAREQSGLRLGIRRMEQGTSAWGLRC